MKVGVLAHPEKSLDGGLDAFRAALTRRGVDDLVWQEAPSGDAVPGLVAGMIDEGIELLFAWGGDGTVKQCIEAIGAQPLPLAVMPAGTANLLAVNLGIPTDLEAAVDIGLFGRRRRIDVGRVDGELFAVVAGTGFDAALIAKADDGLKERWGSLAYLLAGIGSVGIEAVEAVIDVDGRRWFEGKTTLVLVANMGSLVGGVRAFPGSLPDDGLLEVGVATAESAAEWARTFGRLLAGDPTRSPLVVATAAERIDVRLARKTAHQVDGEDRPERQDYCFRVVPQAVTVCVPDDG